MFAACRKPEPVPYMVKRVSTQVLYAQLSQSLYEYNVLPRGREKQGQGKAVIRNSLRPEWISRALYSRGSVSCLYSNT